MSAFMAQSGNAGRAAAMPAMRLGDSIYEARLYVRGKVKKPRRRLHREGDAREHPRKLAASRARQDEASARGRFRRYGSARKLYNFNVDNADAY
jgi:hypothetical protein